ncbi:hypothetical protein DSC45_27375 [Streptomyces sp. YIM 130001]|uniref:hypothetical protein n=1 Tax=Streptomyces sp. YIM 130001 TaxID=2259644 RepID=UPI000EDF42BC|nr:hypothetical protein [Streptomyces sp. YIM 130001]RII12018.1 hypothetical protein DSC45_27375 [Streptomyces sp. YIM 130001]
MTDHRTPPARARSSMPALARAARRDLRLALRAPAAWPSARWGAALGAALLCALVVGLPTALIPSPVFGRSVPPEWWNLPVLVATSVLAGLLFATYVRTGADRDRAPRRERASRLGTAGAVLSFLAVGCPVCNKLVLLALGTSGALTIWAPLQPALAVVSLALLAVAAVRRLAGEVACPAPPTAATAA